MALLYNVINRSEPISPLRDAVSLYRRPSTFLWQSAILVIEVWLAGLTLNNNYW